MKNNNHELKIRCIFDDIFYKYWYDDILDDMFLNYWDNDILDQPGLTCQICDPSYKTMITL